MSYKLGFQRQFSLQYYYQTFYDMIDFPGKRPSEKVLLRINKHWIVKFKIISKFTLLCLGPITLAFIFYYNGFLPQSHNADRIFTTIWILFFLFCLLLSFLDWFNEMIDMILVTNERIIDINQQGMFRKKVAQAELQYIQDSKGSEKGFFQTIFRYGHINIHTASSEHNPFHMENVADPMNTAEKINAIRFQIQGEIKEKQLEKQGLKAAIEDQLQQDMTRNEMEE